MENAEPTMELSQRGGEVWLRIWGHDKPWIAEIAGTDPKYRYQRNFIGQAGIYRGSVARTLVASLSSLQTPRLLEIQAAARAFYVLHLNPSHIVELAPVDEMTLQELLLAGQFAKAIRQQQEELVALYTEAIYLTPEPMLFPPVTRQQRARNKRERKKIEKASQILPPTPTRKIEFD